MKFVLVFVSIFFAAFAPNGIALKCHVCDSENGNRGKCKTATVECNENQDVCLSQLLSDSPMIVEGDTYLITKRCDRRDICMESQKMAKSADFVGPKWRCIDCCNSDFCNYSPNSCIHTF